MWEEQTHKDMAAAPSMHPVLMGGELDERFRRDNVTGAHRTGWMVTRLRGLMREGSVRPAWVTDGQEQLMVLSHQDCRTLKTALRRDLNTHVHGSPPGVAPDPTTGLRIAELSSLQCSAPPRPVAWEWDQL